MADLERVDICLEDPMKSLFLPLLTEEHLNQLCHVFSYLKHYHNADLVFDPIDHMIDTRIFESMD